MDYFPGTCSLIEEVDKKLLVILRDGRKLIGYLRSFDQFANLVLQDTIERIYVGNQYGDIHRGIYLIRGENVVLLGEIDLEKEKESTLEEVPVEDILIAQAEEKEAQLQAAKTKNKLLTDKGLAPLHDPVAEDAWS
eukprot:Colp12_sorted_trinity150504_noHs@12433